MQETFILTANQVLMMSVFVLLGYFMRKSGMLGDSASGILSTVEVNLFLPALCLSTFKDNFRPDKITEKAPFFIAGIIVIIASFFLALFLARLFAKNSLQRDIYIYSFLIPNIGYMGYPLIGAVFGEEVLFGMMIFTIPFNLGIYTYGMYILNPNREWSLKKLLNPNIIAIALGMILGLFSLSLPPFLEKTVDAAKACMSPIALILTGHVLAAIPIRPLLTDLRLYVAAVIRALVIPGIALAVLYFLRVDNGIIVVAVATLCMPMGLNSVVFPEAFGGDSETGAKTCFISNLISIVTIPVVFGVLGLFI